MLTNTHRPNSFEGVVGQESAVRILKAAAKSPERAPKSMVLYGPWGDGKTTLARVFGRALVCYNFTKDGEICGDCGGCKSFDKVNNRYFEYDSSVIGNIQSIQDLQNLFDRSTDYYRVIVFDESHLASAKAQSALLKVIEEGPKMTFFLFVTTEYDKMLKTIKSRSLPVEFFKIDDNLIVEHLKRISKREDINPEEVSDEVYSRIALRADGHMRDALMTLSGYLLTKDEALINLPINDIREFFGYLSQAAFEQAEGKVKIIMKNPVNQVQRSLHYVMMRMVEAHSMRLENEYSAVANKLGNSIIKFFKIVAEPWVQEAFKDEYLAYAFFLTLIKLSRG